MYHHCSKETGCGKTTLIQRLSELCGNDIIVQNLSLQTDSTDLLGGYRPLELHQIARRVYTEFIDLFAKCYSRTNNAGFLKSLTKIYEKGDWKNLSKQLKKIVQKVRAKEDNLITALTSLLILLNQVCNCEKK